MILKRKKNGFHVSKHKFGHHTCTRQIVKAGLFLKVPCRNKNKYNLANYPANKISDVLHYSITNISNAFQFIPIRKKTLKFVLQKKY